ncbi:MAG: hypothetical protein ACJ8FV_13700 [Xanthobacteraceae bacterium]
MRWEIAVLSALVLAAGLSPGQAQGPASPAGAAPPNRVVRPEQPATMQFERVREGGDCRDRCRVWIAASGRISETSAADFEAFVRDLDLRGATVALESGGGVVDGGLALGRAFRRLGLTTTVGRVVRQPPDAHGERRAALSPRATCASMCVFALLGGVRRHVPDEARVLVHQIWPSRQRDDALAATYSAGNMMRIQRELGVIARYTAEMGADIELFELAMRIPPWEGLRPLTAEELRRMRVHNVDVARSVSADPAPAAPARAAPAPAAATSAAPAPPPVERVAFTGATMDPRGWIVSRQDGRSALVRRYPLTIEGQEIGRFEVSLTCGGTPGAYQVVYNEMRLADAAGTDRLSGVRMTLQRESLMLKIESSATSGRRELVSAARGVLPASLARSLADSDGPAFMVETITDGKQRTAIRIGPAGLADGFRELQASCLK